MARNHCTDEKYYRVRVCYGEIGDQGIFFYRGPYSTKGTARGQLTREIQDGANPELSGIEVTNRIVWEDA